MFNFTTVMKTIAIHIVEISKPQNTSFMKTSVKERALVQIKQAFQEIKKGVYVF